MGVHERHAYAEERVAGEIEEGTHKGHPYAGLGWRRLVDEDDCVDVVWHDDELIQLDCRKSFGQFTPDALDHPSGFVQVHFFVNYVA